MVAIQKKIDTVMANWLVSQDVYDMARDAYSSLKKLNGIRLITVDNCSPMGGGYLREQSDIYIKTDSNLGYAPAMNLGLKLATSKYVAFAENDILVSPNAFDVARHIMDKDSEVGSVHFKMIDYDDNFSFGNDIWCRGKERWCTIAFSVWRRRAFNNEFLDENYIIANYEDWDILHRIRHMYKWKTAYTNIACYKHRDSYTQKKLDPEKRQLEAQNNRNYFKKKWGNYPEFIWEALYLKQMLQQWKPFP